MVELDVHVFSKAAWVVILQGFGISESLECIWKKVTLNFSFRSKKCVLRKLLDRPQAPGWRGAACPARCWGVWCLGSWQRRTGGFSWRPRSCRLRSPLRSGWSGCWTRTAWCGRRCPLVHSCKYSSRSKVSPSPSPKVSFKTRICYFFTFIRQWSGRKMIKGNERRLK